MLQVIHLQYVRLAQLDRAFGYGPKGREFESSSARKRNLVSSKVYGVFTFKYKDTGGKRNLSIFF